MEMDKEEVAKRVHAKAIDMLSWGYPRHQKTDIDRRECHRVVPMEVLCLGPSRYGTNSIRKALYILGYYDVYHMTSFMNENPRDDEMWAAAADAKFYGKGQFGKAEWDQLLGHCMAVTDLPANAFAPELVSVTPKPTSSSTSPTPNMLSTSLTCVHFWPLTQVGMPLNPSLFHRFLLWVLPKFPTQDAMSRIIPTIDLLDLPKTGKKYYREHNEGVRRVVPKKNFLEFNVKQGWVPLCKFLGKELPGVLFPHVNDRAEFIKSQRRFKIMMGLGSCMDIMKYLGGFGVLTGGVCWTWRRREDHLGHALEMPRLSYFQAEEDMSEDVGMITCNRQICCSLWEQERR